MDWNFKEGVKVCADNFWPDLAYWRAIDPEDVLVDQEQVTQLRAAIDLVRSFERAIDARNQHQPVRRW